MIYVQDSVLFIIPITFISDNQTEQDAGQSENIRYIVAYFATENQKQDHYERKDRQFCPLYPFVSRNNFSFRSIRYRLLSTRTSGIEYLFRHLCLYGGAYPHRQHGGIGYRTALHRSSLRSLWAETPTSGIAHSVYPFYPGLSGVHYYL